MDQTASRANSCFGTRRVSGARRGRVAALSAVLGGGPGRSPGSAGDGSPRRVCVQPWCQRAGEELGPGVLREEDPSLPSTTCCLHGGQD